MAKPKTVITYPLNFAVGAAIACRNIGHRLAQEVDIMNKDPEFLNDISEGGSYRTRTVRITIEITEEETTNEA